ncbi:hypothetical protein [Aurantiacibacter rhizosphaerae]|uniref:DUF429 domain-containing protein n=1 Tax=Aurantiacibacter rhizosphaerae TaxID=2691582 RepID=A0A844XCN1_9SPHN|nr:hypothetical protein [Aurantiacibacter rhizosphaerae]MWV27452.1 hypothetical protein [Aurantiacibacter rhizosphaerae]
MTRFSHFVAIDWSGAVGPRHKAIAMAIADAKGGAPVLVKREKGWSRQEVLALLRDDLPPATLVGLDLGISLPFVDCGSFFPGWHESPSDARSLWQMIERICLDDPHLAASSFVDHPDASAYFRRHGGREGARFGGGRGRFRVTEIEQAKLGCKPYSNFNLVGAAQVGKSSLTGMRMLHALRGHLPVWPIDPLPAKGSVIVEIYTSLAAITAGRTASRAKMRTFEELNAALINLGSPPIAAKGAIDDHASDALVTSAWLRTVADNPALWAPAAMTAQVAQTEGWTFGVA